MVKICHSEKRQLKCLISASPNDKASSAMTATVTASGALSV